MLRAGKANIYYESIGQGAPMAFLHAGVADSRQWNNEFAAFSKTHRVIRHDMRGFGRSEPAEGEFTHLGDLARLLDHLGVSEPVVLVGCSMGGRVALDYALRAPAQVHALILVGCVPSGFQFDAPDPSAFALVDEAEKSGNLELVSELETQIWFDGDRSSDQVNPDMRRLVYEMNLTALRHDEKELGTRLPDSKLPAAERLGDVEVPVLAVVGENDLPRSHAAMRAMREKIPNFRAVTIAAAAHLPNMDQPEEFQSVVREFLDSLSSGAG